MEFRVTVVAVACSLLLGGCVGRLETTPYRERTDTLSGALRGVTYSLPKLQYDVKLTRWLAECPGDTVDGRPTALKFQVEMEATPKYVSGEAYTVNYERLAGLLRTSNFEIKYHPSGTLKSMGAGADDKTAEVIKDTVKTGLAVAAAMAGPPAMAAVDLASRMPASAAFSETAAIVCTAASAASVRDVRKAADDLKASTKEFARLTREIGRMESRAKLKLVDRTDRVALLALFAAVDAEEAKLEDAKDRLSKLKAKLGISNTFVWDSKLDEAAHGQVNAYVLDERQAKKLAGLLTKGTVDPLSGADTEADDERRAYFPGCFSDAEDAVRSCLSQQLDLQALTWVQTPLAPCANDGEVECLSPANSENRRYRPARDDTPDGGIFVREPAQAKLLFCRIAYSGCTPARDEAKLEQALFPQLGQLRYLPLKVATFQAREMAISLTEKGEVEAFSYKSTKAPAQVIAATAADVATQVQSALEARETERRDDVKYAREQATADVQAEITRLTKDLELKKLQTPAQADPLKPLRDETAALEAEIALLKAKLAKLEAEEALRAEQS
jgi:hypothetical protein